ncbi:MAG: hypothetical protein P1U65_03320 [Minwuia sp.]|nr:hypothetical protein [Minwuia sp.]
MAENINPRSSLLALPTAPTRRPWLVIFVDPGPAEPGAALRNRILLRLLKRLRPGFRHVLAISPEGQDNSWLVVNPGSDMLAVGILNSSTVMADLRHAVILGRAHFVTVTATRPPAWRFRGLFTCVAAIAHLTGTPAGPFCTPWRFYQHLRAAPKSSA